MNAPKINRAALIEAAAHALHDLEHTDLSCTESECWAESPGWERAIYRSEASAAVDAVLPLIADAIEDAAREMLRADLGGWPGAVGAARLVRSLGGAS